MIKLMGLQNPRSDVAAIATECHCEMHGMSLRDARDAVRVYNVKSDLDLVYTNGFSHHALFHVL